MNSQHSTLKTAVHSPAHYLDQLANLVLCTARLLHFTMLNTTAMTLFTVLGAVTLDEQWLHRPELATVTIFLFKGWLLVTLLVGVIFNRGGFYNALTLRAEEHYQRDHQHRPCRIHLDEHAYSSDCLKGKPTYHPSEPAKDDTHQCGK
ncbi:hypothetical protein C9J12_29435 [Photobacterium frigidiphilum]|uniref:Uncharacterized protein n=1 Tax=Photobacterium frigidiphilum TaxID=264736 RepID=A0A2T3J5V1_9GAMM|nr:hypothetical protein [Photobacterium frigidiphilum]PSU41777.1 hypothetical protein C9J12_29435 [Photobacterium frigidiphilum]